MHEAQRRQLVVGSAVVVTVGIVLYHVLFRKSSSHSPNDANDRTESKQEKTFEAPVEAARTPVAEEKLVAEEVEDEPVVAATVESIHIEESEKPGTVSAEESLHESASEEDETISVADGESTDATEEELVKDSEPHHADESVRHISESIEQAAETVLTTVAVSDTLEAALDDESTTSQPKEEPLSNGVEIITTTTNEVREPVVPKSPWQDLPAVKEANVWESPEWAQQQQSQPAKTVRNSDLNVNSEPFVPKQKSKRLESPEERREMMIKQRQNNASFKARCRYWPKCTNKKCKYVHPMHPCR
ncbi:hypothetical protein Unana1_03600 [Umbelopsis nana]